MSLAIRKTRNLSGQFARFTLALIVLLGSAFAAPPNRITRAVDPTQTSVVPGHLQRLAQPQFDRGAVDAGMPMEYVVLLIKPSEAQQAELDALLADQQNLSSPQFHKWLTPEAFGNRFGLSASDAVKVTNWLRSEGFTVNELARARNWIAFSGTAGQVSKTLLTSFHRFQVDGETHFANISEPSVPEALAGVVGGFLGLNDFRPKSFARIAPSPSSAGPNYNSGATHMLAPEDYATIYDIAPLYQAGFDGTGQGIVVVGQSDVLLSDIRTFRTLHNLPANDPKMLKYSTTDPGFNGAQLEGNLDLEWAGAIAPNATIYYVYGPDAFTAIVSSVNANLAPIITISYGTCEVDASPSFYRSIAQQGNAQGITLLNSSGDSGAAGCDLQGSEPFATRGRTVDFPAALPEVTGVGGTQFVEGTGTYWAPTNSPNLGSALSYIPEAAWNESATSGLLSSGGGASVFYPKPAWQAGPGVPNDNVRDVPDISLSAAGHDPYYVTYFGNGIGVFGTSASAPSMAGIVALLNQYQVSNGFQKQPGLGNINPQLYRLAQSMPAAFHDVTSGSNIVPCSQISPDCLTGSFGYPAAGGYDMATGLGSVDANILVTNWNTAAAGVIVTLSANATKGTLNDTLQATATVTAATGAGVPTGTVSFSVNGTVLGSAPIASQAASVALPLYLFGTGTSIVAAEYSGDSAFSTGGATLRVQVTTPFGVATIVPSALSVVWPSDPDAQGLSWQTTITLREAGGVAAMVTGFTIDGQAQPLSQYFPSPNILPGSALSTNVVFRNITAPVTRTFGFTGADAGGGSWSRQVAVRYMPLPPFQNFNLAATPSTLVQNTSADPSCQWSTQINVDDLGGYLNLISGLFVGGVNLTSQIPTIFGTTRIDAWGSVQGTLCFGGITPTGTDFVEVDLTSGAQEVPISFAGPAANPVTLLASPASFTLAAPDSAKPVQTTLAVYLSDKTQPWTASIFPANRTTAWLSVSQLSGVGPVNVSLTASGAGFEPGVYRAIIVLQSANARPQYINVPVMFVLGTASGTAITSIGNAASFQTTGSPGTLFSIFGSQLANSQQSATGNPLPYSTAGVSVTVNGIAAPVLYASPGQLNIQIPYAVGAGPAVLGVNNNGHIAGLQFHLAPSSPGIFTDGNGNIAVKSTAQQGGSATIYVTGAGEVSPALKTAYAVPLTATSNLPKPLLPISVTVGGVPAFVQFAAIGPGEIGTVQVNFIVPPSVPAGVQPVVVTVGGVSSPPVNLTVTQ